MSEQTEPIADANFDLILLKPETVRLIRTPGGAVRANISDPALGGERTYIQVRIARAFPLASPDNYIGLRDREDKEIGMLQTLEGMDPESRAIIADELDRRYLVPVVTRVLEVREEKGGLVYFEVETNKGPRNFYVQNPRDSTQSVTPTRLLVTDKDGFRYEFPDISRVEGKAQAFFERVT
jgi:hypothetical protein